MTTKNIVISFRNEAGEDVRHVIEIPAQRSFDIHVEASKAEALLSHFRRMMKAVTEGDQL